MKSEKPTFDQVCELMAQAKDGRVTRAMLQAFLEDPSRVLTSTEPRTEIITIAGYEFEQVTHPNGMREIKLGEFEIDYDEPLGDKLSAAKFDWVHHDITAEHYPFAQKGKKTLALSLVNLGDGYYPTSEVEAAIKRMEAATSDLAQQLEVAKKFPELQRELYMVALGSRWRYPYEGVLVPALDRNYDGRNLNLDSYDDEWNDHGSWFLAAR